MIWEWCRNFDSNTRISFSANVKGDLTKWHLDKMVVTKQNNIICGGSASEGTCWMFCYNDIKTG